MPIFPLMAHREDKHHIDANHITIKRDIPVRPSPNNQLPFARFVRPSEERRMRQNLDRADDFGNPL